MRRTYHVEARWDPEAKVWFSGGDVPGLVLETATLSEFEALLRDLAPGLVAENEGHTGPISIEWTAHGALDLEAA